MYLKGQCHEIFYPRFSHDSNPSRPLISYSTVLKYFPIFYFAQIFACAKKLCGVIDTVKSGSAVSVTLRSQIFCFKFFNGFFNNLKRQFQTIYARFFHDSNSIGPMKNGLKHLGVQRFNVLKILLGDYIKCIINDTAESELVFFIMTFGSF